MATVIDFADALNEMKEGQELIELVSEISAILGKKYVTLDTNTRSENYDEYMDKGPRTVFDWGNGVELVFEPDCEDSVTMKIYLLESKWGEDKRPFDLNLKFNKLSRIYGVNGSQIGSGIILSES